MNNNTHLLFDDGTSTFSCTFKNCTRGTQNVVYRIQTDDGKVYIGNAGLEGLLGRLRQYPHEDALVWKKISESGHCSISALAYELDTKKRFILENKFIFNEAKRLLRDKGYNGNYSPAQVNMLMREVSDTLINKRLDRCYSLSQSLANKTV